MTHQPTFTCLYPCVILLTLSTTFYQFVLPQISSKGNWELLVKDAGVSAMHMILLPSNRVIIFDRTDFGPSNISLGGGACREDANDLALKKDCWAHSIEYDIASNGVRPLTLLTDTWCSSGGLNANGDLIQTGGYNDGASTVRRFISRCANKKASCDWQEAPNQLAVSRWYASNQILPDNRFIIVGGRRQFNYEFFPKLSGLNQPTTHPLDFLADTADRVENNLYPFLHLSIDGNLFIFANSKSILLDYHKNIVVRTFPDMPGGEAHNYPSTGSSVMLPLFASNNYQCVDILVCGGTSPMANIEANNDNFLEASKTCGRLRITEESPTWVMQTMPMARVMGDMLLLPTSDVLIINGAQRGSAGWGAARDPAFSPVLYAPYQKHFGVLKPSTTPRLYHSSAILLPDGKILVAGGNTHINYDFTDPEFPTQTSMEAFSPPYLDPLYAPYRPKIAILLVANGVVRYGSKFTLHFDVGTFVDANALQVNMLSAPFTTHSYSMNQRMIRLKYNDFKKLSSSRYQLLLEAPPTPIIAPPGYYLVFVVHSTIPSSGVWVRIH
ncbi:hypothetical protein L7F22_038158 [Adiantum nelumboides]|nr:hypothetical protein [Adiantum nelumboides]